ncbi:MAG: hypothetical protein GC129_05985 [Proteobacteria bacterium]|nr:hypothetical protein [Pseudomonadota bacterium]
MRPSGRDHAHGTADDKVRTYTWHLLMVRNTVVAYFRESGKKESGRLSVASWTCLLEGYEQPKDMAFPPGTTWAFNGTWDAENYGE